MNEAASGTSSAPQVDKVSTDPSDVTEPVTSASSGDLLVDMTGSKVESTDEETVQDGEVVVVEPLPRDAPRTPSLRLMRLTATLDEKHENIAETKLEINKKIASDTLNPSDPTEDSLERIKSEASLVDGFYIVDRNFTYDDYLRLVVKKKA